MELSVELQRNFLALKRNVFVVSVPDVVESHVN